MRWCGCGFYDKDFMSKTLEGQICLVKRLRRNPVWQRHDYGYCWVDLLMLANDQNREEWIQGEKIALLRGQTAWSLRSLEKEWKKSGEWLARFLQFLTDEGMITVDSNRRRTIITILNYEAYNPPITVSETDAEAGTVTVSETEQKGEVGTGNRKGERASAPENTANDGFVEVPDEAEVLTFGRDYAGDIARGIPATIPDTWALDWFRYKVGAGTLPKKWREKMAADFARDFTARHPKALGGVRSASPSGRTPAQQRFELSRELEELQVRLDAAYENSITPSAKDRDREKELKALIKALPE